MSAADLIAGINRRPSPWVAALLLANLAVRLLRIDAPAIPIFDEGLFYIPAAQAYLAGLPDPNPEHPPLGKLLFAAGMALFGDTPLGWRFMSTLAGTAGIGMTYWLGARLWGTAVAGLVAAALLSLDLLWFLFSRLMMYDIFLAAFVLAGLALAWRHRETGGLAPLAGAGVAIGLASAVKWAGLWTLAPALLACAFAPRPLSLAGVASRGALLGAGVTLGYLAPWLYHVVALGYGPAEVVQQHGEMLGYHVALRASADPNAQWTTPLRWLLNEPLNFTSRDDRSVWVPALANPLLFWGGLAAAAWCAIRLLRGGAPPSSEAGARSPQGMVQEGSPLPAGGAGVPPATSSERGWAGGKDAHLQRRTGEELRDNADSALPDSELSPLLPAGHHWWHRLGTPHAFLLVWVLAFYLPWFAFPRIKYFYYLLPLLPGLALALTGGLAAVLSGAGPKRRLAVAGYAMGLAALGAGMYPAVTGMLGGTR